MRWAVYTTQVEIVVPKMKTAERELVDAAG